MLLLSGPPGSGRTSHLLDEFRQALRAGPGARFLTPTATMAEHLRHRLAREGLLLRPNLVLTLSQFLAPWTQDLPQVSPAALYLLVERTALRLAPREFTRVLRTPGFCAALAQAIEEFAAAGCDSGRLERMLPPTRFGAPFVAVYREVERELAERRAGLRSGRLERAAGRIARQGLAGISKIWMDGFLAFTDPELAVIRSLAAHADLTLTLPERDGPRPDRDALLAMGCEERRMQRVRARPAAGAFRAPSIGRESEEIALRILDLAEAGREFREIGIVVRNPEVYAGPLRAALERFGIPARFYFPEKLDQHRTARYVAGVIGAILSGWDWAGTLAALRYSIDSPALDRFDFLVREKLPGRGLDGLAALASDVGIERRLAELAALDSWRTAALAPAQWAARLSSLGPALGLPDPGAGQPPPHWRSHTAALAALEAAFAEAAAFLDPDRRIGLGEFWTPAAAVLRLTPLRPPDHRRNVVHVLSVFEARQWELPAVFVCGLAEQQFPKRRTQDPLFPDAVRRSLAQQGIRVRAAADREREERFMFELAITRATSVLTLSYAETDGRGTRQMPSQFLTLPAAPCDSPVRPAPPAARFVDPGGAVAVAPRAFSPSGLECFLDCPFQFFARYSLKLRGRPLPPQERLDFMLQGNIIHDTLAEWHRSPQPIEPLFDRVFAARCAAASVFMGYRTEYLRCQMLDDLRQFAADRRLPASADVITEYPFEMEIEPGLVIRGRIDRIDKLPDGRALIVDYKYSAAARVAEKVEKATLLQGGLYALAVERELKMQPAAVFYFGLKKDLRMDGWSDPPDAFAAGAKPLTRAWIDASVDRARAAAGQIRSGRIAPAPAWAGLCRLCDFRDVCRYDGAAQAISVEAPVR
ncbi:MAG TPA: PD-(D/E)XK nuclease family protein [Bryobacteraceae bacterium]|nr:PD-(D/E)XK nuclease family protein [Bryobacteraceae bacterium]